MNQIVAAWKIRGIVQGVGFRYFALRQAQALGLCGWVRNLADGSVEVACRGDAGAVGQLRQIVSIGPGSAQVDRIEDLPVPPALEGAAGFTIR